MTSANPIVNKTVAGDQDFTQINPLVFLGSKSKKDPYEILHNIQKYTEIMGVTQIESVDMDTYQMQGVG